MPSPLALAILYAYHDRGWSIIPIHAFEHHGHQTLSTTVDVAGHAAQLTFVGKESTSGGVEDMKLVVGPARPKATRVQQEGTSKKTASKKTASKKTASKKPK